MIESQYRRTKIVATIGPVSSGPEIIRQLISAGMDVARLNFSHGSYEDHAKVIQTLRSVSGELNKPVTILQDLQGPKIRVGKLGGKVISLIKGEEVRIVPERAFRGEAGVIPVDYPYVAEEAAPGMQILLADGLFELRIEAISGDAVECLVVEGGELTERKGVNFPDLKLRLPSLTEKDIRDLEFGLSQDVDWLSLSFVRSAEDIHTLRAMVTSKGLIKPIIAKIEKPQAIEHLDEIIEAANGIMVARGDLGVELSPEKVPMLQKKIIEHCNREGKTVITATQMLESMIHEPRPTRAEASDVANAIVDGTDAIMLSGETAMGAFPVRAVEMMARIAFDVESKIDFRTYPPVDDTPLTALCRATNQIAKVINPSCIAVLTASGLSARAVAAERPNAPVFALTTHLRVYHGLNLLWGVTPILIAEHPDTFEEMVLVIVNNLVSRKLVGKGEKVVIVGGIPAHRHGGTNFVKIHQVG